MHIEYITHACTKIKAGDVTLLSDPWIIDQPIYNYTTWKFPPINQNPEEILNEVTHVYISHTHEDHFHVPSLSLIHRDTTIVIPSFNWHAGPRANILYQTLKKMGFTQIKELDAWETESLGNQLSVTMIPAADTKSWDWENSGLVINADEITILNLNDCPTDEAQLKSLDERFPFFDLALIQYAGVTMYPGRFRMPLDQMKRISKQKKHSFVSQDRLINLLNIHSIIPFAGDFCWLDDELFHCNWACRGTPKILEEWLENSRYNNGIEFLIMYPNDIWDPINGLVKKGREVDWENYLYEIEQLKNKHVGAINEVRKLWHKSDISNLKSRTIDYLKVLEDNIDGVADIKFSAKQRVKILSEDETFSFVLAYEPKKFSVLWDESMPVDQTFRLPDYVWGSVLDGVCMFSQMAWLGETEQHVDFRTDLARMWFWNEYYLDLNNRSAQLRINSKLHPKLEDQLRYDLGIFHHPH